MIQINSISSSLVSRRSINLQVSYIQACRIAFYLGFERRGWTPRPENQKIYGFQNGVTGRTAGNYDTKNQVLCISSEYFDEIKSFVK